MVVASSSGRRSSVDRSLRVREVVGSIPAAPTSFLVEAEEGIFQKLTTAVLTTFRKLIADTAEIVLAFVKDLTVGQLTVSDKTSGQAVISAGGDKLTIIRLRKHPRSLSPSVIPTLRQPVTGFLRLPMVRVLPLH